MTARLTDRDVALLNEPNLAYVATVMADGTPQITPVWVDTDGATVQFNTARGRVKTDNIERNPAVAVLVVDAGDPYRWLAVRGEAELVDEGADAQIDRLAKKYLNVDSYPGRNPAERRVTVKINARHRSAGPNA